MPCAWHDQTSTVLAILVHDSPGMGPAAVWMSQVFVFSIGRELFVSCLQNFLFPILWLILTSYFDGNWLCSRISDWALVFDRFLYFDPRNGLFGWKASSQGLQNPSNQQRRVRLGGLEALCTMTWTGEFFRNRLDSSGARCITMCNSVTDIILLIYTNITIFYSGTWHFVTWIPPALPA